MTDGERFEVFLVAVPGLEEALRDEAAAKGFTDARRMAGGVAFMGTWRDVWRANLELRGASQVLARIGEFPVTHLAQLDKRARSFPWGEVLRRGVPVRVEASCKRSKLYHSGAVAQRIETAIREELGAPVSADADIAIKARVESDLLTLSVDTSGELLHKRGAKQAMAKAPMRETMAALFLRQCGYTGSEPVLDPMCGSGTFVIEAAEIAAGLAPGRNRSFAFEKLATFDANAWAAMKAAPARVTPAFIFHGSDRDQGSIAAAEANAKRADVAGFTVFERKSVSDIAPPDGPPGLVICNPPYGSRIGEKKPLFALYAALGQTLRERFAGWRVGIITSDAALARATGLPFKQSAPVLHGGLRVYLFQTGALQRA
ncbi:MAG: class I SAM-dependent RNA methyltransferase [Aestuariivirga sp.]